MKKYHPLHNGPWTGLTFPWLLSFVGCKDALGTIIERRGQIDFVNVPQHSLVEDVAVQDFISDVLDHLSFDLIIQLLKKQYLLDVNQTRHIAYQYLMGREINLGVVSAKIKTSILWVLAFLQQFDLITQLVDQDHERTLDFNSCSDVLTLANVSVFGLIVALSEDQRLIRLILQKNYRINFEKSSYDNTGNVKMFTALAKKRFLSVFLEYELYQDVWQAAYVAAIGNSDLQEIDRFKKANIPLPFDLKKLRADDEEKSLATASHADQEPITLAKILSQLMAITIQYANTSNANTSVADLDLKPINNYLMRHLENFVFLMENTRFVRDIYFDELNERMRKSVQETMLSFSEKLQSQGLTITKKDLIRTTSVLVFACLQIILKINLPIKTRIALRLFALSLLQLSPSSSLEINLNLSKKPITKNSVVFFDAVTLFLQLSVDLTNDVTMCIEEILQNKFNQYTDVMQYLFAIRLAIDANLTVLKQDKFFLDGVKKLSPYFPERALEIERVIKNLTVFQEMLLEDLGKTINRLTVFFTIHFDVLTKAELKDVESIDRELAEISHHHKNAHFSVIVQEFHALFAKIARSNPALLVEDQWLPKMVVAKPQAVKSKSESKRNKAVAGPSNTDTSGRITEVEKTKEAEREPANEDVILKKDPTQVDQQNHSDDQQDKIFNEEQKQNPKKTRRNRHKERHAALVLARHAQQQTQEIPAQLDNRQSSDDEVLAAGPLPASETEAMPVTTVIDLQPKQPEEASCFSFQCSFFSESLKPSDGKYHLFGPGNFRYASGP